MKQNTWEPAISSSLAHHSSASTTQRVLFHLKGWADSRDYDHAFVALTRLATGATRLLADGGDVIVDLQTGIANAARRLTSTERLARALLVGAVAVGGGSPDEWPAWRHMVDHGRPIRPAGGPGPFHPVPGVDTPTTARRLYAPLVGVDSAEPRLGSSTRGDAHVLRARFGTPTEHWGLAEMARS